MSNLKQIILEAAVSYLQEVKTDSEFTHVAHIDPKTKRPDLDGNLWGMGKSKDEADKDKLETAKYEGLKRGPKTHLYRVHKDAVNSKTGGLKLGKVHVDHDNKEIRLK